MAVQKQIYAAVAPWTVSQIADVLRDALVGSGLMTSWYDSFSSDGFEHRVLEVVYSQLTYGKTYYWFIFSGTQIRWKTVAGWDIAGKRPKGPTSSGSATFDWPEDGGALASVSSYSPNLLATTATYVTLSSSVNMSITRYTGGGRSFFVVRSGTSYAVFTIDPPSTSFRSWYQSALAGGFHAGIWEVRCENTVIRFFQRGRTKRCPLFGGSTDYIQSPGALPVELSSWGFADMQTSAGGNGRLWGSFAQFSNNIPQWVGADINNGVLNDFLPVFNGFRPSVIYNADLPLDFGLGALRGSAANSISIQDTVIVATGTEEYEALGFVNRGIGGQVNPLFLARTVG